MAINRNIPVKNRLSKQSLIFFRRLGILDNRGKPVEMVSRALKILKIDLFDLEVKQLDDYIQRIHLKLYDEGGDAKVR